MIEKLHQEYDRLVQSHTHDYAVVWLSAKYRKPRESILQMVDSLS